MRRVREVCAAILPWLPVPLSVYFLFRFVPPCRAVLLLLALLSHEGGHFAAFFLFGAGVPRIRPVSGGFRIASPKPLSYRGELLVALAGPAAGLIPGACLLLFGTVCPYAAEAGRIFFGTGLSNLIPIADHDGGRALFCLLAPRIGTEKGERIAAFFSYLSLFVSLFLSFSLLYAFGAGFYFTVFCLFSLLSHPLPGDDFF